MNNLENQKIVQARQYASVAIKKGKEFYDYENNMNLVWGSAANYVCKRKVGRGKYSEVFEGFNLKNSTKCIIKVLKPIKFAKINREVKILMSLGGKGNCIKLLDLVKEGEIYSLIFEHVDCIDYSTLSSIVTPLDCRYYFYQILLGLQYCNSQGIMHRDIKPQNVLIDHNQKKVRLIDWGLAQFYLPLKDYNVRVSSRYYKAPQLLVGCEYYNYSLDIWSLGVTLAAFVFRKEPFLKGTDNVDQLVQITKIFGTRQLYEYLQKYKIYLQFNVEKALSKHPAIKLQSFINESNSHLATPDVLDLMKKMLVYDHYDRPTVQQCMKHYYFDPVRNLPLQ